MRIKITYHPFWWIKQLSAEKKRHREKRMFLSDCIDDIYSVHRRKIPVVEHLEFNQLKSTLHTLSALVNYPPQSKPQSIKRKLDCEHKEHIRKQLKPQRNRSENIAAIYYRRIGRRLKMKRMRRNYMRDARRAVLQNIGNDPSTKSEDNLSECPSDVENSSFAETELATNEDPTLFKMHELDDETNCHRIYYTHYTQLACPIYHAKMREILRQRALKMAQKSSELNSNLKNQLPSDASRLTNG